MTKDIPLIEKIGRELAAKFRKSISIEEIQRRISTNSGLQDLMHRLQNDESLRRFLFSHPQDLLAIGFGGFNTFLPVFFDPYDTELNEEVSDAVNALSTYIENEYPEESIETQLRPSWITEKDWNKRKEDFKDVVAYFALEFLRDNPVIMELANDESLDFSMMKAELKDYTGFSTERIEEMLKGVFLGGSTVDPIIYAKIEKLVLTFIQLIIRNPLGFLMKVGTAVPDIRLVLHSTSRLWQSRIMTRCNLSVEDYLRIMDTLHELSLISAKQYIMWCQTCGIKNTLVKKRDSIESPSNVGTKKCDKCGRLTYVSGIYEMDKALHDPLISKDGLLPNYLGWLLSESAIAYKSNLLVNNEELDIVVDGTLIECRIFSFTGENERIEASLQDSIQRIVDKTNRIAEEQQIDRIVFLWNRYDYDDVLAILNLRYHSFIKKYNFLLLNPNEIDNLVKSMKMNYVKEV